MKLSYLVRLGRSAWAATLVACCALAPLSCADEEERTACPAGFVFAVRVTVRDSGNAQVAGCRVIYTRDGGAVRDGYCFPSKDPTTAACYLEDTRPGSYWVKATSADGLKSAEESVVVVSSRTSSCESIEVQHLELVLK